MWTLPNHVVMYGAPKVLAIKIFRRKNIVLCVFLLVSILAAVPGGWWLSNVVSQVLMLPSPPNQHLKHFLRSSSLRNYLNRIELLIEPSPCACESGLNIPLLILVSSAPHHFRYRDIIRHTWAKKQPTYFVIGNRKTPTENVLEGNQIEAKNYNDVIVFDFHDHYQNLTLKTALMLQWTLDRCPQAQFLFKTDDDVLVNPWTLKEVIRDNSDAQLVGYSINNTKLHRDEYNKYYVPRRLYRDDLILQYLSGTGYLIKGVYVRKIYYAAFKVPLVNVEDVFITYLVARKELNLTLTHDRRLSPKKPWIPMSCIYWNLATVHSLQPTEIIKVWSRVAQIAKLRKTNKKVCDNYKVFNRDLFLY